MMTIQNSTWTLILWLQNIKHHFAPQSTVTHLKVNVDVVIGSENRSTKKRFLLHSTHPVFHLLFQLVPLSGRMKDDESVEQQQQCSRQRKQNERVTHIACEPPPPETQRWWKQPRRRQEVGGMVMGGKSIRRKKIPGTPPNTGMAAPNSWPASIADGLIVKLDSKHSRWWVNLLEL